MLYDVLFILMYGAMRWLGGWGPVDYYTNRKLKPPRWRAWVQASQLTSKAAESIVSGALVGLFLWLEGFALTWVVLFGVLAAAGVLFSRVRERGYYFTSFHGRTDKFLEDDGLEWVNNITNWVFAKIYKFDLRLRLEIEGTAREKESDYVRKWGWIGMTVRGLYAAPMFLAFAPLSPIFIGAAVLAPFIQGFIYYSMRKVPEPFENGETIGRGVLGIAFGFLWFLGLSTASL